MIDNFEDFNKAFKKMAAMRLAIVARDYYLKQEGTEILKEAFGGQKPPKDS